MYKHCFIGILISCCSILLYNCSEKPDHEDTANFTKADSVTDTYLQFQDSILAVWNEMISDDNLKIDAMHDVLHELQISGSVEQDEIKSYEERLQQLKQSRYTQKTMANEDIIQEYDFASNSLVSELISLAESQRQFAYNSTLQKLVDNIRLADQRVNNYRAEYDRITMEYNDFVENNKEILDDTNSDSTLVKKPLFQVATEE
ncbi:hypothetical protein [Chryseosolibacter indicus]|uniref:Cell-wall binding lipoprotein n=1 Tax=Chryseosolibacter indicus TaxID=2782351 RepID=A0ABS5VLP9_9BACT|nr:hypothetical protein [Chryseosolibacter indicus]MBT1702378.1 hypothetical protein [Chryseosolibacter indicus]